jgi:multisite-specific tRNA:(cytosine-C5)-methyltransferase
VKMFMKQDVQAEGVCKWRIQSEGMPILEGYVGEERVVRLYKKETLRKLLIEMFPKLSEEAWKNLGEIGERVNNIGMGCCVLRIEPSNEEDGFEERMVLPLWRSLHSLNLMLAKEDRTAMLLRIFNDTTPLIHNQNLSKKRDTEDVISLDCAEPGEAQVENGEAKVDTNAAIDSSEPVNGQPTNGEIAAEQTSAATDAKAEEINDGGEAGGKEEQLNGDGDVEGTS